jgi:hypothetical protein
LKESDHERLTILERHRSTSHEHLRQRELRGAIGRVCRRTGRESGVAGGKEMKRKMMMVFVGFALFAGLCFACSTVNDNIKSVSLMQLIVNPEKYHGELVRVIGVSRIEFEGDSVWFTKEHYKHNAYMNSLWIEPDYDALGATRQQLEQLNGKYVLMEGVFNKDNHGHLGMYSGALEKITRFQLWEE